MGFEKVENTRSRENQLSCPRNNMAEVTRDIASSDWLKLAALCLFRAQSVSNKSICDCAGARPQSNRSRLLSNSLLIQIRTSNFGPRLNFLIFVRFEPGNVLNMFLELYGILNSTISSVVPQCVIQ